jgi:ANTAR domain
MDTRGDWAQILSAVAAPAAVADRNTVLRTAVMLGLDVGPATVGCSVTERVAGGFRTPLWTNPLSLVLDHAQYGAGAGPCLSATVTGRLQRLDAVTERPEYRAFATAAGQHGVHSSLSIPLPDPHRRAALNFYASVPAGFASDRTRAAAYLLARCLVALRTGTAAEAQVPAGALAAAQSRRRRVEEAEQVLMSAAGLSRQAAFDLLVRRSRAQERSIFRIADDLLGIAGRSAGGSADRTVES